MNPTETNAGQSTESDEDSVAAADEKEIRRDNHATHRFWVGALCGFITALLVCAAALFIIRPFEMRSTASGNAGKAAVDQVVLAESEKTDESGESKVASVEETESDKPEAAESNSTVENTEKEDVAPTQPSDQKVYDTITKTRYLTTMAQDHYGNFNFWPYIYKENQSILGHPDRIKPGTKVVVPPLSKYGVKVSNPY